MHTKERGHVNSLGDTVLLYHRKPQQRMLAFIIVHQKGAKRLAMYGHHPHCKYILPQYANEFTVDREYTRTKEISIGLLQIPVISQACHFYCRDRYFSFFLMDNLYGP